MSTSEGIYKSIDNGLHWVPKNLGIRALDIRSFAKNNEYLFAGTTTNGMFRSNDQGNQWTIINIGLNNINSLHINEIVTYVNTIVIATSDGVYTSENHGDSWVKTLDPGLNKSAQCIAYKDNVFMTAVSGDGVYKSVDNGKTWILGSMNGMDTDTSFYSITIQNNMVAVSTHSGAMYLSTDLGNSWQDISITSSFHLTFVRIC